MDAKKRDAKRFAKLLIAEIRLYNDYKIKRILHGENFRDVLKDEIEEAKKKYQKRGYEKDFGGIFEEMLLEIFDKKDVLTLKTDNSEKVNEFTKQ